MSKSIKNQSPRSRKRRAPLHQAPERQSLIPALCAVVDHINELVDVLDHAGKRVFSSASYSGLGLDHKELVGTSFTDRIHPNDRAAAASRLSDTLQGKQCEEFDYRMLMLNGTERLLRGKMIRHLTDGEAPTVVVISRDITAARQAERERRLLAYALTCTKDCFIIADPDERIVYVNNAFVETYGFEEQEILGRHVATLYAPEHASVEEKMAWWGTFDVGRNEQLMQKRKDGTLFPATLWTSMVRGEDGTVAAYVGVVRDNSARRAAEEALLKSEERHRAFVERTSEGIWCTQFTVPIPTSLPIDAQIGMMFKHGHFTDCNEAMARMYGLATAADVNGQPLDRFLDRHDPQNKMFLASIVQSGYTLFDAESHERDARGASKYFLNNMVGIVRDGGLLRLWGTRRDITGRRWSEQLQQTVYQIAQISDLAQSLDDLFIRVHELIRTLVPANNFYIALYDEVEGILSFPYFVDEVDSPSPPQRLGRGLTEYVLRTGKSILCDTPGFEELIRRGEVELVGEPSEIWLGVPLAIDQKIIGVMVVQDYKNPLVYGEHDLRFFEYVSSQIAKAIQRKQSEDTLKRLLALRDATLESTADGILAIDQDGGIVGYNKKLIEMLKVPAATVQWKDEQGFLKFIRGQVKNREQLDRQDRALASRPDEPIFDILELQDGRTFERYSQPQVVDGRSVGRVWSFRDISDRKKLEEQLLHAQKMEGIGTLAGGIAHDFNNLLQIILAHSTMGRRKRTDVDALEKIFDNIDKSLQRGSGLVRQLLTFATKTPIMLQRIDANSVVTEIAKVVRETFPRLISIEMKLDSMNATIEADPTQLHLALLNLCVNARDAMMNGGTLTIATYKTAGAELRERFLEARGGEFISIAVHDTGQGIEKEILDRIFEPFFTTKGPGKGTGLGLAVVYGIVKSHNGFIEVSSSPEKGTTFTIHFPMLDAPGSSPEMQSDVPAGTTVLGGSETILIVEDETLLLDVLTMFLTDYGYTVLRAGDGMEALELYKQHRSNIALVLSDMGLPKIGGWEVFRRIREMDPDAKVILASGYLDPKIREEMVGAGAVEFLQKPYQPYETLGLIRHVLDTH